MVAMAEVVRITDSFCDRKNPESIDRQGKLGQVAILVFVFYIIMGIAFVKMQELEKKKPRIIHDVDVAFELYAPPPEPSFKVGEVPKPISLSEGENANPGSEAAPKPSSSDTVSLPSIEAPETQSKPTQVQARPVASHTVTESAPVMVTSTNMIKTTVPSQAAPKSQPNADKNATMAGVLATAPTSGSAMAGGTPDSQGGGIGEGGQGTGGTGTGSGDGGSGSGTGIAGGQIATRVESARAMGNIAPYRKDMLIRIAQNWHPKRKNESIVILVTIDRDGKLLSDEVLESSGNKKSDKEALAAIEATEFAGLPDWYKGEQLQFKINLDKVEALQQ
jgi:TonB family protein